MNLLKFKIHNDENKSKEQSSYQIKNIIETDNDISSLSLNNDKYEVDSNERVKVKNHVGSLKVSSQVTNLNFEKTSLKGRTHNSFNYFGKKSFQYRNIPLSNKNEVSPYNIINLSNVKNSSIIINTKDSVLHGRNEEKEKAEKGGNIPIPIPDDKATVYKKKENFKFQKGCFSMTMRQSSSLNSSMLTENKKIERNYYKIIPSTKNMSLKSVNRIRIEDKNEIPQNNHQNKERYTISADYNNLSKLKISKINQSPLNISFTQVEDSFLQENFNKKSNFNKLEKKLSNENDNNLSILNKSNMKQKERGEMVSILKNNSSNRKLPNEKEVLKTGNNAIIKKPTLEDYVEMIKKCGEEKRREGLNLNAIQDIVSVVCSKNVKSLSSTNCFEINPSIYEKRNEFYGKIKINNSSKLV